MIDDGTITIGTEVSTKGIKKDLADLEKELEKYDEEAQKLLRQRAELEVDTSNLEKLKQELKEAQQEYDKLRAQRVWDPNAVDTWGNNTGNWIFPEETSEVADKIDEIQRKIVDVKNEIKTNAPEIENINGKLENNKLIQDDIKKEYKEQLDLLQQIYSQEAAEKTHNEQIIERQRQAENLTRKFKRVGLALLGVGSVYGLVRKLAREYMNEHEEQAAAFKQVWANIVEFIMPLVEKVVNWLMKMLAYLNVFIKTVTGGKLDLTKKMNKNEKSVKATSKAVKELNNQMAQFDDATKLSDNRSLDVGVGIQGVDTSALDSINNIDLNPKWVSTLENIANKIRENWPFIKEVLIEVGAIFGAAKVGEWLMGIGNLLGYGGAAATGAGGAGLVGLAVGLLAVTAALSTLAAWKVWSDVIDNYKRYRQELENPSTPGVKSLEVEKKMANVADDTTATQEQINQSFKYQKDRIKQTTNQLIGHTNSMKNFVSIGGAYITIYEKAKGVIDGSTTSYEKELQAMNENARAISNYIDNTNKLIDNKELSSDEIQSYIELLKSERIELRNQKNSVAEGTTQYRILDEVLNKMKSTIQKYDTSITQTDEDFNTMTTNTNKNVDYLTTKMDEMKNKILEWNATKPEEKTFSINYNQADLITATTNIGENIAKAFGKALQYTQIQLDAINQAKGIALRVSKVLGLASGGLINLPGPGVPIAPGVVGGERAPEGIIPFTNEQVMETLGEAIGRHVTINAEVINSMNGRVISRELQKINNENTFMMNR